MEGVIKKISFTKKPIPLPVDYRPHYKMAQIVIILKLVCRGNTSSLLKLHLFSWALKNDKNKDLLWKHISSNFQTDFSVWGIEPTLNRALHIAVAEELCTYSAGKYSLAEKGISFFNLINKDSEVLSEEINFLMSVGKNTITDSRLNKMANKWTLFNANN